MAGRISETQQIGSDVRSRHWSWKHRNTLEYLQQLERFNAVAHEFVSIFDHPVAVLMSIRPFKYSATALG